MKLGLVFQKKTYAIAIVTFIPYIFSLKSDFGTLICLDTSCDITFIDKT